MTRPEQDPERPDVDLEERAMSNYDHDQEAGRDDVEGRPGGGEGPARRWWCWT